MTCASCASLIQLELEDAGYKCNCSFRDETLTIDDKNEFDKVLAIVKAAGYTLVK